MTNLLLVRHGETAWNAEGVWQGHQDVELNDAGRAQAHALGTLLAEDGVTALYSSDLRRAADTAEILAGSLALPVALDARLREIDVGEWSGLSTAEVAERWPDALVRLDRLGYGWLEGETNDQLSSRVYDALVDIAARHPGGPVVVVTHGGPIRTVLARIAGIEYGVFRRGNPPVANCAVVAVALEQGSIRRID